MTPTQVQLIRSSWGAVEPIADKAAAAFYARLFELDSRLAPLFLNTDLTKQRKVLMQTLAVVVKNLDRLDEIVPAIQALGRRHAGYGVKAEHYATVGAALIWTLQSGLGAAFTRDTREAWETAYDMLASVMIAASQQDSRAAA
jgi:hemoglobin-like flavoprotein